MAAWLRVLANPRVLKRFLGTRAGKKATLKYGSMLLKSRMAQKVQRAKPQQKPKQLKRLKKQNKVKGAVKKLA